jgi:restriction system protein
MVHAVEALSKLTGVDKNIIQWIILLLILICLVQSIREWFAQRQSKVAKRTVTAVQKIAIDHVATLSRKRAQLVYYGDYGEMELGAYYRELNVFYDKIVWPVIAKDMNAMGLASHLPSRQTNLDIIAQTVENHDAVSPSNQIEMSRLVPTDPILYEAWCAAQLKACGWNARTTKVSGDQGADIIADKNGRTLVVQCKLYSSDVGNKAVQEVIAARTYYRATNAAVVTSTSFTKSARQLAGASDVLLLHHSDLSKIESLIEVCAG